MVLIWKDPVFKSKGTQDEGAGYNSIFVTSEKQTNKWKAFQGLAGLP